MLTDNIYVFNTTKKIFGIQILNKNAKMLYNRDTEVTNNIVL